jgi:hypothetical protein
MIFDELTKAFYSHWRGQTKVLLIQFSQNLKNFNLRSLLFYQKNHLVELRRFLRSVSDTGINRLRLAQIIILKMLLNYPIVMLFKLGADRC